MVCSRRGVPLSTPLVLLVSQLFLVVVVPLVLFISLPGAEASVSLLAVWVGLAVAGSRLALIAKSARKRIVLTTFWAFSYVFLGVAPFAQVAVGAFPWPGVYSVEILLRTELVVLAGFAAFELGWRLPAVRVASSQSYRSPRSLNPAVVAFVGVLALVVSAALLPYLGGVRALFVSRVARHQIIAQHLASPLQALFQAAASTPIFIVLVASVAMSFSKAIRGTPALRFLWLSLAAVFFCATVVLNNPVSAPRFKFGTIAFALFFSLPWRRWSNAAAVAVVLGSLVLVFPFAALFRTQVSVDLLGTVAKQSIVQHLVHNGDYDAFQQVANAVKVVDQEGIQYGRQVGGALLFFIPRNVWPQKPDPTGQFVAQALGYGYTNLSEPLWGEFFVDGSFAFLFVGFLLYGRLVRSLDRRVRFSDRLGKPSLASVIGPVFAGYQVYLLRGALMPALAFLMPMMLVAVLCGLGARRRTFHPSCSQDRNRSKVIVSRTRALNDPQT